MAMPRPSNKALTIAEKVIPGMPEHLKSSSSEQPEGFLSEVEVLQTNNIENFEGLKNEKRKTSRI